MLVFHRHHALSSGAYRGFHAVSHRQFRLYLVETAGLVRSFEHDGALTLRPSPGRHHVTMSLAGQLDLLASGRELTRGHAVMGAVDATLERWRGEPFAVLVLEWERGTLGEEARSEQLAFSAADVERLRRCAHTLRETHSRLEAAALTREVVQVLRAHGLSLDAKVSCEASDHAASDQRLADVLGEVVSPLAGQPMMVDLVSSTGLSDRHLRRRLPTISRQISSAQGAGFREMVLRLRLTTAAGLLARGDTTVNHVAKVVGYGSARALHHAMGAAGMPRPSSIRPAA